MQRSFFKTTVPLLIGVVALLTSICQIPTDPSDPSNTSLSLVLKSSTLSSSDDSHYIDTLGAQLQIGIATNLTMNVDSARVSLVSTQGLFDTAGIWKQFTASQKIDTFWIYCTLRDTGKKTISAELFVKNGTLLRDTVILTVFARINHPPTMLVTGEKNVEAGKLCSLSFGANDPDAGQHLRFFVDNKPDSAIVDTAKKTLKWFPVATDTGVRTILFRVVDDGFPSMADSEEIVITVLPGSNKPPKWQLDTIADDLQPGAVFTKNLSLFCVDPENGALLFFLQSGAPQHDTIIAGTYVFTPQTKDTGVVYPKIIAIDPSGAADTVVFRLIIKYDSTAVDNIPPVMRLISPSGDTIIPIDSFTIRIICNDASGVGTVVGSVGKTTFTGQKQPGNDSVWLVTVRGLSAGRYTQVTIVATDATTRKNRDSLSVRIKYDNDLTKPKLSRIDPLKDSTIISANSYTVKVVCSDASGIASLICSIESSNISAVKSGDSVWSINVTGLEQKQFSKVTIIAVDSSLRANRYTLNLFIKYDPTIGDNVGPVITCLTPLPANMVTADSIIILVDSIYDENGVDSVFWMLNSKNRRSLATLISIATGGTYQLKDTLRQFHYDTIEVVAIDKSSAHNRSKQLIIFNFNVPPVARDTTVTTVLNTPKTIILSASSRDGDALTWSRLTDPDHGSVGLTGATVTYTPATDWVSTDSFLVSVSDGTWNDTARVKITITDTRVAPKNVVIVMQPASGTVMVGQPLTLSVTMNSDATPEPT